MAKWPYNTARWQRLRRAQLSRQPLCRTCQPDTTPADTVDHIVPHRGDPDLAFDAANLQSLCHSHHASRKALQERQGYDPGVGDDGWPRDPQHPANRTRGAGKSSQP